jgi:iron(III) transport system permease protein
VPPPAIVVTTADTRPSPPPALAPVRLGRSSGWAVLAVCIAALIALPVIVVASRIGADTGGVWTHLAHTVLPGYIGNTVALMAGVAAVSAVVGTGTAWLVTMFRFPGSRVLEWALLLPLAVPAYVMAYVYTDLLQVAGPVQGWMRAVFGWTAQDYRFPQIRSLAGAILVMGFVLYPYVYMLGRAAFLNQSVCVLEVGRTLGSGPWRCFFTVGVPLARPAIVAGLTFALMEAIADYGTVSYFGVDTFTTGIYRTWFGMGAPVAATQLAAVMLVLVAFLVILERWSRGQARVHHTTGRWQAIRPASLSPLPAAAALLACFLPVAIGFLVPGLSLIDMSVAVGDPLWGPRFFAFAGNSFVLAAVTTVAAVVLATLLAYGLRLHPTTAVRGAARLASLGYAVPGSVIAVGILLPFSAIDNAADAFLRDRFGISSGLVLTGTVVGLVYAYLVRFLAVSFNTVEASLGKISPSMDHAARTLGHNAGQTLLRVHAPLIRGGMVTAALLVFVDVMKELPATLILRPFNFDTLAVRAYRLASDERLAEASTAALVIVAVGILPVILLSRSIGRSRPGEGSAG